MHNVYVMSHASDIDGVGSAALIRMKYGVPLHNIFFTGYTKDGLDYINKSLSPHYRKGITLFLTDLGANKSIIKNYLRIIGSVKRYGGKVIWFDHHPWTERSINALASRCDMAIIGENDEYCATEITRHELGLNDAFTRNFVKIVHYSDFNISPKDPKERDLVGTYALSIASYNMSDSRAYLISKLRHMVEVISSRKLTDKKIISDRIRFEKINEQRVRKMVADLDVRKRFAIGFSKDVQTTFACTEIMKASGRGIAVYINTRKGSGHIRTETANVSHLAGALGGGGHPHASGFSVNLKKYKHFRSAAQRKRFTDLFERLVKKYL